MAWLVSTSLSFAVPLRASLPTLTKGVHQLDSALARLSSKATISTAQKVLGSFSSNKQILSVKGSCQNCLMSCARFLYETSSYNLEIGADFVSFKWTLGKLTTVSILQRHHKLISLLEN